MTLNDGLYRLVRVIAAVTHATNASCGAATQILMLVQLLTAIAPLDRGLQADLDDVEEVDRLCRVLEKVNPNPESLSAPEINGKWRLIYTTSDSILGATRPAFARPSGPIYQFIGARFCTTTTAAAVRQSWCTIQITHTAITHTA